MKQISFATWAVLAMAAAVDAQDQQVGARTKAMGGSYTAFEDDPVSVWLNPAGIATQPDALALAYQTYTTYDLQFRSSLFGGDDLKSAPTTSWNDPALIPSFLGVVLQVGTPDNPTAVGFCFTSPYQLSFPLSSTTDDDVPNAEFEQVFYRFRASLAHDFMFSAPGTPGWFTHLSLGVAFDIAISRIHFQELSPDLVPGAALEFDVSDTAVGGGLGMLIGLYDNTQNLKVNLGAAYQSRADFSFSASPTFATQFDWPHQVQLGATFYLLEGMPLRITLDGQWIDWDGATADSSLPDGHDFQSVVNYSIGAEYRLRAEFLAPRMSFYPRVGFRRFDTPWETDNLQELPAIRSRRMIINTKGDVFQIWSVGLGIGWTTDAGKSRSIDVAFDRGGDSNGIAMGFTLEF